jgi:hypothetical protein
VLAYLDQPLLADKVRVTLSPYTLSKFWMAETSLLEADAVWENELKPPLMTSAEASAVLPFMSLLAIALKWDSVAKATY